MLGRDLPEVRLMPHPPPCIWAHLHDRSLQPLYLHYVTMLHMGITLQIYRREGRGPPPLSPVHAPPWHLVVTPAPAGSNAQGSSHQPWHQSLTVRHRK